VSRSKAGLTSFVKSGASRGRYGLAMTSTRVAATTDIHHDGTIMMRRTQIMLDPDEHRRASEKAAASGISLAEYIRRLVSADLDVSLPTDISSIIGIGDSGGSNIAKYKDEYIGEAIEAEWKRKTGKP
jgi:hypothetical protein